MPDGTKEEEDHTGFRDCTHSGDNGRCEEDVCQQVMVVVLHSINDDSQIRPEFSQYVKCTYTCQKGVHCLKANVLHLPHTRHNMYSIVASFSLSNRKLSATAT